VGNLLHNAAKFTPRGGEVSLLLRGGEGTAEIVVRDTGMGIDRKLLEHMFDPFIQGERTLARTEGGLGLGLALVKSIAELHGGSVHADSAGLGRGAEFTVRLPRAASTGDSEQAPPPASATRRRRCRVLVVDDNADAAESLGEIVRMLGHEVSLAYDGDDALATVRANGCDVVLCDLGLPGLSGFEVARTLRAEAGGALRLFAVSGYAQPEDVKAALEAGFDGHLAKPCTPEDIERLVG
jgi:CheY-like chemotaxis protein